MTETAGLPAPETSDDTPIPGSADWIARQLEEDIVIGRLHPRERLVEDDLMARFEVKRHVVREALATLDRMGLVERRRNVGALVRFFSSQQVQELYALRSLLEVEAARPAGVADTPTQTSFPRHAHPYTQIPAETFVSAGIFFCFTSRSACRFSPQGRPWPCPGG